MTPQGVIFDFDGVLVDSLESHLRAWVSAVEEVLGINIPLPVELSGYSTRTIAHIICQKYGQPALAGFLASTKDIAISKMTDGVKLYPGVKDIIQKLANSSIPIAIGSNSSRTFVTSTLTVHGIEVRNVVTASDVTRPKPAPDIFWACSNLMNIPRDLRQNVLIFEDSPHGIEAAIAAAMTPVGITTAVDAAALRRAGAKITFSSVAKAYDSGLFSEMSRALPD
jgi:beta-phosphoglucomutase